MHTFQFYIYKNDIQNTTMDCFKDWWTFFSILLISSWIWHAYVNHKFTEQQSFARPCLQNYHLTMCVHGDINDTSYGKSADH